jgi:hypothetical protein
LFLFSFWRKREKDTGIEGFWFFDKDVQLP